MSDIQLSARGGVVRSATKPGVVVATLVTVVLMLAGQQFLEHFAPNPICIIFCPDALLSDFGGFVLGRWFTPRPRIRNSGDGG